MIWLLILLGSIAPINTTIEPGRRDVIEASLEVGEKFFAFLAVTAKTYFWRLATFGFIAGFSIIKKGLEVHFGPAPARVAGRNWAFAGALTAKAFEQLAYAVRLTPASKAWESLHLESLSESNYISTEQWVPRCMWAASHYQQHLLDQQKLRIKIDKDPRVGSS